MMTREEARVLLKVMFAFWANTHERNNVEMEMALNLALSALRPVSREQVEKVWRAHWNESVHLGGFVYCSRCGYSALEANNYTFCPKCGSPFTDKAVDMVMERINEMEETTDEH